MDVTHESFWGQSIFVKFEKLLKNFTSNAYFHIVSKFMTYFQSAFPKVVSQAFQDKLCI